MVTQEIALLLFSPQMLDLENQLHTAALSGDANRVQSLIGDGVDVNAPTEVCVLVFNGLLMSLPGLLYKRVRQHSTWPL